MRPLKLYDKDFLKIRHFVGSRVRCFSPGRAAATQGDFLRGAQLAHRLDFCRLLGRDDAAVRRPFCDARAVLADFPPRPRCDTRRLTRGWGGSDRMVLFYKLLILLIFLRILP